MIMASFNLLVSCGSDSDDDNNAEIRQEQQEDQGQYHAIFSTLNSQVVSEANVDSSITINEEDIMVDIDGEEVPMNVTIRQYIYSGNSCPSQEADTNNDGYIDYQELLAQSGQILIPLNNDLSAQEAGSQFPSSGSSGSYTYEESASLEDLISNLREPDTDPDDDMTRLSPDERLNLGGRVLVIHGVDRSTSLPESVQTRDGLSAQESLPIACSVIQRGASPQEDEDGSGGSTGGGGTDGSPDNEDNDDENSDVPRDDRFDTRLNSTLRISGQKCEGGETVVVQEDSSSRTETCEENQWLVIVDNENTCNENGSCTEIGVNPIIAVLERANIPSPTTYSFYNIEPDSQTTEERRRILENHWVRFDLNGSPEVQEKDL
jgi:hypothetical protein